MDGIKKTALLLSGLEWKTVDRLLGRLDVETARAVRREMMSLGSVSETETNRVAGEFLRATDVRSRASHAEEPIGTDRTTYAPPHHRQAVRFTGEAFAPPKPKRPFDFLRRCEAEQIAHELAGEHPQTVAVVLAHLPPTLAGEVLGRLPKPLQVDVARRLSEYEEMDPQMLLEIESSLQERLEHRIRTQQRRIKGTAVMKEILRSTDPGTQAMILSDLESPRHEAGAVSLDCLDRLGDSELSTLFHHVDAFTAMLALVGAKPTLIERVVKRFSPTEEFQMRQELKRLGPIREQDVYRARRALLEKAELLLRAR